MGTALITGASSGLGVDFAKLFAADGHHLILVARRRDKLEELARAIQAKSSGTKITVLEQDLGKPGAGAALAATVNALGLQVDFLVNNAGSGTSGTLATLDPAKELEMIDLNVRALAELTRLFLPAMISRRFGRILNVGSTAGFQPGPWMTNYYASKAFVNSFSEGLHEELLGTGVTCTLLAPGATRTGFANAAGIGGSRLFKAGAGGALPVVRAGYRGMQKGRAVVVPGLQHYVMFQALRFTPRILARKIAGFLNRSG